MTATLNDVAVGSFADGSTAYVSPDDAPLAHYTWRRDAYGYVVRSKGKQNIYLAREVIARQGIEPGRVRFHDSNPLNCTRGNVYVAYAQGSMAGIPRTVHTRQPSRFHRQRVQVPDTAEGFVPPEGYLLRWHEAPCALDSLSRCRLVTDSQVIGVAARRTRVTEALFGKPGGNVVPDGWSFTDLTGETYTTKSYDDGCGWVLAGLDLTARYPSALSQGRMLATIATIARMEGS